MKIGQWIQAELDDSSKKNTIAVLDGVRAFACLFVIGFHINATPLWNFEKAAPPVLTAFLIFGRYGVTLFFVLSGFLLFMPFAKALLFEKTWPSTRRFYLRRFFRIVPAYYLSLILIVLLFQRVYLQPQHLGELGLFFAFLMDSTRATYQQLNAPFWTLAIEWQYYLILPLLVLGMRLVVWRSRQQYRLPATMACILALIAWGVFTRYIGNYFVDHHPTATMLVPRSVLNVFLFIAYGVSGKYLEDFGVGMLLSLCFIYAQHPSTSPRLRTVLHRLSPWLWISGLLCLSGMILWDYSEIAVHTWPILSDPFFVANYFQLDELGFALSFGLCILALLFGSGWLRWLFEWAPLRWVGMISFSLYMWHFPLLFMVFTPLVQPLLRGWPLALNYDVYWLWVVVVIIPFCFLFYNWIEKPGMKFGEKFYCPKTVPAPPVRLAPSPEKPAIETTRVVREREMAS